MSTESTKRVMNQFVQFINTADAALAAELISTEAIFYIPGKVEPLKGPQGYLDVIAMMRGGFSDIQWSLNDMVIENGRVAARFTLLGTHDGVFSGIPATGKSINVQAVNFYRLEDEKIVEEYGQPDLLSLLQQIGAFSF